VPAIAPDELERAERAKWLLFMHVDAADYGLWTFRCRISPRLIREVKIY
jgi:hypothetical protein